MKHIFFIQFLPHFSDALKMCGVGPDYWCVPLPTQENKSEMYFKTRNAPNIGPLSTQKRHSRWLVLSLCVKLVRVNEVGGAFHYQPNERFLVA